MATKKRSTEVIIDTKITNESKEIEKSKQKTTVFKDESSDTLISFSNSTDENKFIRVLKDDDGKTFVEFESSMFVDNHGNPLFPGEGSIKRMPVHEGASPEKAPIDINFRNGQTSMEVKAEDGKIYHFHVDATGVKVEVDSKSYHYNSKDSDGNVASFNAQVSCECVEELMLANSTLIRNYHVGKAKYSLLPPFLIQAYCKTKGYKKAKDGEIKTTLIKHPKNKKDDIQGPEFYIVSVPGAEDPYIIAKTHDGKTKYLNGASWNSVKDYHFSYNHEGGISIIFGKHKMILASISEEEITHARKSIEEKKVLTIPKNLQNSLFDIDQFILSKRNPSDEKVERKEPKDDLGHPLHVELASKDGSKKLDIKFDEEDMRTDTIISTSGSMPVYEAELVAEDIELPPPPPRTKYDRDIYKPRKFKITDIEEPEKDPKNLNPLVKTPLKKVVKERKLSQTPGHLVTVLGLMLMMVSVLLGPIAGVIMAGIGATAFLGAQGYLLVLDELNNPINAIKTKYIDPLEKEQRDLENAQEQFWENEKLLDQSRSNAMGLIQQSLNSEEDIIHAFENLFGNEDAGIGASISPEVLAEHSLMGTSLREFLSENNATKRLEMLSDYNILSKRDTVLTAEEVKTFAKKHFGDNPEIIEKIKTELFTISGDNFKTKKNSDSLQTLAKLSRTQQTSLQLIEKQRDLIRANSVEFTIRTIANPKLPKEQRIENLKRYATTIAEKFICNNDASPADYDKFLQSFPKEEQPLVATIMTSAGNIVESDIEFENKKAKLDETSATFGTLLEDMIFTFKDKDTYISPKAMEEKINLLSAYYDIEHTRETISMLYSDSHALSSLNDAQKNQIKNFFQSYRSDADIKDLIQDRENLLKKEGFYHDIYYANAVGNTPKVSEVIPPPSSGLVKEDNREKQIQEFLYYKISTFMIKNKITCAIENPTTDDLIKAIHDAGKELPDNLKKIYDQSTKIDKKFKDKQDALADSFSESNSETAQKIIDKVKASMEGKDEKTIYAATQTALAFAEKNGITSFEDESDDEKTILAVAESVVEGHAGMLTYLETMAPEVESNFTATNDGHAYDTVTNAEEEKQRLKKDIKIGYQQNMNFKSKLMALRNNKILRPLLKEMNFEEMIAAVDADATKKLTGEDLFNKVYEKMESTIITLPGETEPKSIKDIIISSVSETIMSKPDPTVVLQYCGMTKKQIKAFRKSVGKRNFKQILGDAKDLKTAITKISTYCAEHSISVPISTITDLASPDDKKYLRHIIENPPYAEEDIKYRDKYFEENNKAKQFENNVTDFLSISLHEIVDLAGSDPKLKFEQFVKNNKKDLKNQGLYKILNKLVGLDPTSEEFSQKLQFALDKQNAKFNKNIKSILSQKSSINFWDRIFKKKKRRKINNRNKNNFNDKNAEAQKKGKEAEMAGAENVLFNEKQTNLENTGEEINLEH